MKPAKCNFLFLFLFLVGSNYAQNSDNLPSRIILNLTEDPSHSIAITWRTKDACDSSFVEYTLASIEPINEKNYKINSIYVREESVFPDSIIGYSYSIILSDLKPCTRYAYRVGNKESWSEWNEFTTASENNSPINFTYLGDPQNQLLNQIPRIFREAYRENPKTDFWLFGGDLVTEGNIDSWWNDFFTASEYIFRTIPVIAAVGNHEYRGPDKTLSLLWRSQFNFPLNGIYGLEETNYYIDYQNTKIVILNSKTRLEEQAAWLDKLLSSNKKRWVVLCFHYPVYSIAKDRDNPQLRNILLPIIDKYHVDLVLNGHDHAYGRTYKIDNYRIVGDDEPGTVYITSVSGPKQYQLNSLYDELFAVKASNIQLFQVINVEESIMNIEVFGADGKLFDKTEIKK
jgi:hypothetical protein